MSAQSQDNAINSGKLTRALIYTALLLFAIYYLLPLYVMLVNSFKPLEEIRQGGMLNLPQQWTIEPWLSAWSTAQIGVQPTGLKPFFINSILMVVPAVAISTIIGALNGYVLTKWRFRGSNIFFGLLLLSCFIPFQIVLIPMARMLGLFGIAGTIWGLIMVHVIYGLGFTTLYFRNYYEAFPTELVRAAQFLPDFLAHSAAVIRADHRRVRDLAVHQYLERLPVRRILLRREFHADDGGAQQPRFLFHRRQGI
jgi:glucose/mannose transport system permease protein